MFLKSQFSIPVRACEAGRPPSFQRTFSVVRHHWHYVPNLGGPEPLLFFPFSLVSIVRFPLYAIIVPEDRRPEIRPMVTTGPAPLPTIRADCEGGRRCSLW